MDDRCASIPISSDFHAVCKVHIPLNKYGTRRTEDALYIPGAPPVTGFKWFLYLRKKKMIPKIKYEGQNFILLAGPCVIEGQKMAFEIAEKINGICDRLKIPFVFKGSYRKANRSRLDSFSGIGDRKALKILQSVGEKFDIPTVTDIHSAKEAELAAHYVDVLQIPAFLCRQTDILIAAAATGKVINIKKGQFLSPDSMQFAVNKIRESGNNNVMITERGTTFGYQDLVVDYRGIPEMKKNLCPVILDITHSLQQPNQSSGVTGGKPDLIETIARAGIAVGADGIFIETHPNPAVAKSDGANMLRLDLLENLLTKLVKLKQAVDQL
jgi:2-dehydro-3-deoxyphosphooctonate aldolase (KDO 8-P synthase)